MREREGGGGEKEEGRKEGKGGGKRSPHFVERGWRKGEERERLKPAEVFKGGKGMGDD